MLRFATVKGDSAMIAARWASVVSFLSRERPIKDFWEPGVSWNLRRWVME